MNPIQKRIAIAEACGWRRNGAPFGRESWITPQGLVSWACPSFLTDLNAMAQAVLTLNEQRGELKRFNYALELACAVSGRDHRTSAQEFRYLNATPGQRADAFLMAKGLLK